MLHTNTSTGPANISPAFNITRLACGRLSVDVVRYTRVFVYERYRFQRLCKNGGKPDRLLLTRHLGEHQVRGFVDASPLLTRLLRIHPFPRPYTRLRPNHDLKTKQEHRLQSPKVAGVVIDSANPVTIASQLVKPRYEGPRRPQLRQRSMLMRSERLLACAC